MRISEAGAGKRRLSLTPVIDVVFLLLLFFMLASTFTRFANVEIGLAGKAVAPAKENQPPVILISVKKDSTYLTTLKISVFTSVDVQFYLETWREKLKWLVRLIRSVS